MGSMMKLEVRVAGIPGEKLLSRVPQAQRILARAVLASCEPFVPYDTGALCRSGQAGDGVVTYTADHAAKCYYSRRPFRKDKHPQACAGWFEAAKAVSLEAWRRETALALLGEQQAGTGKEENHV